MSCKCEDCKRREKEFIEFVTKQSSNFDQDKKEELLEKIINIMKS